MEDNGSDVFASSSSSRLSGQYNYPIIVPDDDGLSTSPQSSSNDSVSAEVRMTNWHNQQYGGLSPPQFSSSSASPTSGLEFNYDFDVYDDDDRVYFEDDVVDLLSEEEIITQSKKLFLTDWPSDNDNANDHFKEEPPENIDQIVDTLCDLFDLDDNKKDYKEEDEEEDLKPLIFNIKDKNNALKSELPEIDFDVEPVLSSLTSTVKTPLPNAIKPSSNSDTSPSLMKYLTSTIILSSDDEDSSGINSTFTFKTPFRVPISTHATFRHTSSSRAFQKGINGIYEKRIQHQDVKRKLEVAEKKPKKPRTPRKRARRQINAIISNADLAKATREAKRAEKNKRVRLTEKQRVYDETEFEDLHPGRIILDFDLNTQEILAEVEPKFVSLLKTHQIDGIKFLFNSIVESVERLEMNDKEEKDHSYGGILAHCMGLGKTFQVIVFIQSVLTNPRLNHKLKRVLLILPLNVIKNWEAEFHNWFDRCSLKRSFGLFELHSVTNASQRAQRLKQWHKQSGVLMVTPKLFSQLIIYDHKLSEEEKEVFNHCLLDPGPDMVIIDEGHCLKNVKSDLNKTTSQIRTLRRVILTGTPMQNNLNEYFTMVSFVKPNLLGSKKEFDNQFANPIQNGSHSDSTDADVRLMKKRFFILHKFLEYSTIHRRSYAILEPDLPPRFEFVLECRLTEMQKTMYEYYLQNYVFGDALCDNSAKKNLFLHFNILGYIWNHPALLLTYLAEAENKILKLEGKKQDSESDDEDEDGKKKKKKSELESVATIIATWDRQLLPKIEDICELNFSAKFALLYAILGQCERFGDKILVFSQSLLTLDLIEGFLKKKKLEFPMDVNQWQKGQDYFRIDGSVSSDERAQIINRFNNPQNGRSRLILISTRAGGVGINLVGANRAIIFDSSWNPANDVQAIYRIFRYGQTKPVFVYRFAAHGTMESKIYKRQIQKQSVSLRVVDEFQVERHFKDKVLRELYVLTEDEQDENRDPPVPPKEDKLLWDVFAHYRDMVVSYHHHNSLLENLPEEKLSNEEEREAWNEYLSAVDASANLPNHALIPSLNGNVNMSLLYQNNWNSSTTTPDANTSSKYEPYFNNVNGSYGLNDQFSFSANNAGLNSRFQQPSMLPQPSFANYNPNAINSNHTSRYQTTNPTQHLNESTYFQAAQNTTSQFSTAVHHHPSVPNHHNSYAPPLLEVNASDTDIFSSPQQRLQRIAAKRDHVDKVYSNFLQRQNDYEIVREFCEKEDLSRMQLEIHQLYNEYEKNRRECDILEQFNNKVSTTQSANNDPPSNPYMLAPHGNATNNIIHRANNHVSQTEGKSNDDSIIFLD